MNEGSITIQSELYPGEFPLGPPTSRAHLKRKLTLGVHISHCMAAHVLRLTFNVIEQDTHWKDVYISPLLESGPEF